MSLIVRETQIITMRHHFAPHGNSLGEKRLLRASVGEDVWSHQYARTHGGSKTHHRVEKTAWQLLIKLKTHLAYDPNIPFLGISPRYMSTRSFVGESSEQAYSSSSKVKNNPNGHQRMVRSWCSVKADLNLLEAKPIDRLQVSLREDVSSGVT